jgi:hypothetical protein
MANHPNVVGEGDLEWSGGSRMGRSSPAGASS